MADTPSTSLASWQPCPAPRPPPCPQEPDARGPARLATLKFYPYKFPRFGRTLYFLQDLDVWPNPHKTDSVCSSLSLNSLLHCLDNALQWSQDGISDFCGFSSGRVDTYVTRSISVSTLMLLVLKGFFATGKQQQAFFSRPFCEAWQWRRPNKAQAPSYIAPLWIISWGLANINIPDEGFECDSNINIHHCPPSNFIQKGQVCHLIFLPVSAITNPYFVPDFCCFHQFWIFHDCPVFNTEHATLEILLKH